MSRFSTNSGREGNFKREQLSSTIQRELQKALARGLSDPRIRGLVTITEVELNHDGKEAIARVSVLPQEHENLTMHGLKAASGKLRRDVSNRIRTRTMPAIRFEIDKGFKKQQAIMDALARENRRDEPVDDQDNAQDIDKGDDQTVSQDSNEPKTSDERGEL